MTAIPKAPAPRMTVEEFLAWPGDGMSRKHQLVDGEPRAMAPASPTHGTIQANVAALLRGHFMARRSPCYVAIEPGVVPRVRSHVNMRVPDLGVSCVPNEPGHRSLPEPALLVEILSPSNEAETWESVWAYATIPSVREILVVRSTRVEAELLRRQPDGSWPEWPEFLAAAAELRLDSVGLAVPLAELYAQTHLAHAVPR
jgi:Uma2 family endonuclease